MHARTFTLHLQSLIITVTVPCAPIVAIRYMRFPTQAEQVGLHGEVRLQAGEPDVLLPEGGGEDVPVEDGGDGLGQEPSAPTAIRSTSRHGDGSGPVNSSQHD